jgi:hypothetical protein
MADMTSNPPPRSANGRRRNLEFYVYFTLIFLLSLPFAFGRWMRDIARYKTLNLRGPMARAWSEADRMTPLIFSL